MNDYTISSGENIPHWTEEKLKELNRFLSKFNYIEEKTVMNNPNPECPREDCRFAVGIEMTTSMYYPPVYDKQGNNLNPDGNITSGEMTCSTCNKKWKYSKQYGETTFQECASVISPEDNSEGC